MSEFTPVTTSYLPEAPYQPVEVILSNLQRFRIYARFARNMSLPVTAYRRIEGIKKAAGQAAEYQQQQGSPSERTSK